jgi:hypothetical protein
MSGWLDAILGRIRDAGVELALGYGLDFKGGLKARLNPSTKFIDVTLGDAGVAPAAVAAEADSAAVPFVLRVEMTAGTPGTADDVQGPDAPFALRIVDRWADVNTAISATNLRVRTASGGSGNTLSGLISTATVQDGVRASNSADQDTLASGASIFVRRSDRGVAGNVYLMCIRSGA